MSTLSDDGGKHDNDREYAANLAYSEVWHMTVEPRGSLCSCGKRGCLEALASTSAIIVRANAARGEHMNASASENVAALFTIAQVIQQAQEGD